VLDTVAKKGKNVEKEVKEEKIAVAITSDLLRSDNISGFSMKL
jgi:hypothetical protein